MQSVKSIADKALSENQTQTYSTATAITVPPEAEKILGTIIFRTRLAKGWNGYEPRTQSMAVQTWFEILQTEKVPHIHFDELYRRACNYQAFVLQQGKEPPEMSAQLMLAQWIGNNGLRFELEERRKNEGRTLAANAESACQLCFGTKFKSIVRENGTRYLEKCNHGNK